MIPWFLPSAAELPAQVEVGPTYGRIQGGFHGARVGWQQPLGERVQTTVAVSGWSGLEAAGSIGFAWQAVDRERLRLGPFVAIGGHAGPSPLDDRLAGRAGLSLDVRGDRVAFTTSIPVVGGVAWRTSGLHRMSPFETLAGTELALGVRLGENTASVRLFGPNPMLGYTRHGEQLGLDVAVGGSSEMQLALTRVTWRLP